MRAGKGHAVPTQIPFVTQQTHIMYCIHSSDLWALKIVLNRIKACQ